MMRLFGAFFCLLVVNGTTLAQAPFYQGKTIRIVTGYPAGDVNDLWPRLIARHMGKYIAGNPSFIVQNMPGASSMIAANYVYSVAKPDGLTLGWIAPTLYFDQLVGRKEARYDWGKYSFIGSPAQSEHHLYMRADSPYKTIEDVRTPARRPTAAPAAPPARAFISPSCSKKPSAPSSTSCWATRAAAPSTWRWKRVRSSAAP
jgi:tripartite-type tricarboxylate transporter receptor subunit TctC